MLESPQSFRPARADWMQACAVAIALFALYAASAPRTVAMEDDGLFILSSYFLGIEHPPGYPLFTLIGHLFSSLPFGSVAYRVHLVSALFGGLSCGMAWLCARALVPGRLPAYLAALGLGVSPVLWSQAIIAEVYTLNLFFFMLLVFLGLQASPQPGREAADGRGGRVLPWMAFVFGLSLSNHWPLMLLVGPAFAVLLWPLRGELLRRLGFLSWLVLLGLAPYVWMVYRSWAPLPISFYGPLDTLHEVWFFVSRAGYADVDQSSTAGWLDHIRFVQFQAGELLVQFALAGTLVAAIGCALQRRFLGSRVAAFLTIAFLMPTVALILLLGFDYDSMHKHIYHVYPLPAYAIAALWMALGFAWLARHWKLQPAHASGAVGVMLLAMLTVGARHNLLEDHEWGARYAQTLLKLLPPNAVVLGQGDPDLVPMAYFHMIENRRPDITLYHPKGLVLGNRLFHSQRTDTITAHRLVHEMVEKQTNPVVSTLSAYSEGAQRERWLYSELDRSSSDPKKVTIDIPEEATRFFEESVARSVSSNAWVAFVQGELRRRYGVLLAQGLPRDAPPDERTRRHLELLAQDFYGVLGIAEGLMKNEKGYSTGAVALELDRARSLMPSDVPKEHLSRFFYIRGALRANLGERRGAIEDMETALAIWRTPANPVIGSLEDLYRAAGDLTALKALQERIRSLKQLRG